MEISLEIETKQAIISCYVVSRWQTWNRANLGYSCKFLLNNKLLCAPDKCRINSWRVSKLSWQKQQLNRLLFSPVGLLPLSLITFRCTEHKCFNKCAFCLNMATHKRHANGFSPVWTRRWVFKFHDIPNCLPQYSHLYSRKGMVLFPGI